jgi:hypothetical protein
LKEDRTETQMGLGTVKRDCWPTKEQLLLLKAALLQEERATKSWQAWNLIADINTVDSASYRMLPLLSGIW